MKMYQQDYDGYFPPQERMRFYDILKPYRKSPIACPSLTGNAVNTPKDAPLPPNAGYALNLSLLRFVTGPADNPTVEHESVRDEQVTDPVRVVMWCEQLPGRTLTSQFDPYYFPQVNPRPRGYSDYGYDRHFGGSNIAFVDAHVKWYKEGQVLVPGELPSESNKPTFSAKW